MPQRQRGRHDLDRELERLRSNSDARSRGRRFHLGARWTERGDSIAFLYRDHQLICDETDLDRALDAFRRADEAAPHVSTGPVGLAILNLGERDAATIAERIADVVGDDSLVTLNHVLDAQSGYNAMCPATEAAPWY